MLVLNHLPFPHQVPKVAMAQNNIRFIWQGYLQKERIATTSTMDFTSSRVSGLLLQTLHLSLHTQSWAFLWIFRHIEQNPQSTAFPKEL